MAAILHDHRFGIHSGSSIASGEIIKLLFNIFSFFSISYSKSFKYTAEDMQDSYYSKKLQLLQELAHPDLLRAIHHVLNP